MSTPASSLMIRFSARLSLSVSALAAMSATSGSALAQLPPPALPGGKAASKAPTKTLRARTAPATAPARRQSIALPSPVLPLPVAPAPATPQADPVDPVVEVDELPSQPPTVVVEDLPSDGEVIVVPPDASEFPLPSSKPKVPAKAAKPKKPAPKTLARVGGVDTWGLTQETAMHKLRVAHLPRLSQPFVLRLGAREWWTTRAELGARIPLESLLLASRQRARPGKPSDVELRYELDEAVASKYLGKIAPAIRREPQPIGDGSSGRDGEEISLGGSLARLKAAIENGETQAELLTSAIRFIPKPKPVVEEASSGRADFPILLGQYSTRFKAREVDRTENLRIAAREINNTILQPGQVFSANAAIGPRSTSRGFRAAHIFMGKKVVDGVGGGICQSATTVYNAALQAKLTIVERHSHSLPVSYATPKNDATIYWGQKDLRFRNTSGAPILVRTFLKGNRFHAQIFGARAR